MSHPQVCGAFGFLNGIVIVVDVEERGGDSTVEILSIIHTLTDEECK